MKEKCRKLVKVTSGILNGNSRPNEVHGMDGYIKYMALEYLDVLEIMA